MYEENSIHNGKEISLNWGSGLSKKLKMVMNGQTGIIWQNLNPEKEPKNGTKGHLY